MRLKFASVSRPVLLAQGMSLLPSLARAFAKWPFQEVPAGRHGEPMIGVLQDRRGGIIQAPWADTAQRYANAADLANGLASHVTRCWLAENEDFLGISAAATRFGEGLVVFVGGPQSGKSLLAACLSASGHAAFADSVLPVSITMRQGRSLGLAPRLKLPLPASFTGPLRARINRRLDQVAPNAGYLQSSLVDIAAFGDMAPIRAFVLLDRTEKGTAALRRATASTLLKRLLLVSSDALPSARTTLALLHEMVTDTPCYRLIWSNPADAISALRGRFSISRPREVDDTVRAGSPPRVTRRRALGPRNPAGRLFRHVDGLDERTVDGDMFLVDPHGEAIYHLNGLGAGLWRLLDGSHGLDDVISVLRDAFPTADRGLIEGDVARLISDLTDRGLLVELSETPTAPDRRPPTP